MLVVLTPMEPPMVSNAKSLTTPDRTVDLDAYDEAIFIGFTGQDQNIIVRPRQDGKLDRTRLAQTLQKVLDRLNGS